MVRGEVEPRCPSEIHTEIEHIRGRTRVMGLNHSDRDGWVSIYYTEWRALIRLQGAQGDCILSAGIKHDHACKQMWVRGYGKELGLVRQFGLGLC